MVGQVSHIRDDFETVNAVTKILELFDNAEEMSLAEWARSRGVEADAATRREPGSEQEEKKLKLVLEQLESIKNQEILHDAIAYLALSAGEWKSLAWMLTGYSVISEQDARQTIETFLSDRLLLDERIEGIKRQFNSTTPPPWGES